MSLNFPAGKSDNKTFVYSPGLVDEFRPIHDPQAERWGNTQNIRDNYEAV